MDLSIASSAVGRRFATSHDIHQMPSGPLPPKLNSGDGTTDNTVKACR